MRGVLKKNISIRYNWGTKKFLNYNVIVEDKKWVWSTSRTIYWVYFSHPNLAVYWQSLSPIKIDFISQNISLQNTSFMHPLAKFSKLSVISLGLPIDWTILIFFNNIVNFTVPHHMDSSKKKYEAFKLSLQPKGFHETFGGVAHVLLFRNGAKIEILKYRLYTSWNIWDII